MSHIIGRIAGRITTLDWPDNDHAIAEIEAAGGSVLANIPARLAISSPLPLDVGAGVALTGGMRFERGRLIAIATRLNVFSRGTPRASEQK